MKQYGLTAQRILRVVKNPERTEEGIVRNTIAVMQPSSFSTKNGKRVWTREIWAMYEKKAKSQRSKVKSLVGQKIKIISAWRYPGVSPKRDPIPNEILQELESML
ncbi:MAG: hypothetical protein QMD77_00495 [Patescibacteria group bacterium]|nr:hypothetical protein [Patescibacteria group bacterium]